MKSILIFTLLSYCSVIIIAKLNLVVRNPDSINMFVIEGVGYLLGYYSFAIILYLTLLVSFIVLSIGYRHRVPHQHNICLVILVISMIFCHSFVCLYVVKQNNDDNMDRFKRGVLNQHGWRGWDFYKMQDYFHQTLQRIKEKHDKQEISVMQQNLQILDGGLYSLKRWLVNHVFAIDLLYLVFRSVGVVALIGIYILCVFMLKLPKCCFMFVLYVLVWAISVGFFVFSEIAHSLHTLNSHDVCQQAPHSGKINIIIDKRAQDQMIYKYNLGSEDDPYHIFISLCSKVNDYYTYSVKEVDEALISNVLGVVWVGCLLIQIMILITYYLPASSNVNDECADANSYTKIPNKIVQ